MTAQPERPYSIPSFKKLFPQTRTRRNVRNTKCWILQELQTIFKNKAIRNLSSHHQSPIETAVLVLGLTFVPATPASILHLVLKLANWLTQTMKKQFYFRNQPQTTKRPTYCKTSTWIPPEPNSTNLTLLLKQIHMSQDPISPHNKGPPSKN